jgi:hypothetical protein
MEKGRRTLVLLELLIGLVVHIGITPARVGKLGYTVRRRTTA